MKQINKKKDMANEFWMIDKLQKGLLDLVELEFNIEDLKEMNDNQREQLREIAYRWIICLTEKV